MSTNLFTKIQAWWMSLSKKQQYWIIGSTLAIFCLGIIVGDTPMNIAIGTVGMFYVACYSTAARGSFLLGVVYVCLYTVICLQNRIMLDALQNIILIPIYIASFIHWGKAEVKPRNMNAKQRTYSIIGLVILIALLYGLSKLLHGNYSMLDAINTGCTLFAMAFGYLGYTENWLGWTINNAVSALTFGLALATPTGSIAVFAMKMVFFINGLIGWYNFHKLGKEKNKEVA